MSSWSETLHSEISSGPATNEQRRELVFRFPDIAAKLTEPPLELKNPQQWSGFIPGSFDPEDARGIVRLNVGGIRHQLLAILSEAAHRADGEAAHPPAPQGLIHMPVHRNDPAA